MAGGRVGLRISPNLLAFLAKGRQIVLVSATNGKTTTTAMIAAGWGGDVTTNSTGSNMPAGHVGALASSKAKKVVLEVDEAWLSDVVHAMRPALVVLLNLSRDQLDRANEVRQMAERWKSCLGEQENSSIEVVANANDPLVVYAASSARNVSWCDVPTSWLADARSCPVCTRALVHQSSAWHCSCGFSKPLDSMTILRDELAVEGESIGLKLALPGTFNEANAAMAITALKKLGVPARESAARIEEVKGVAGRFTMREWRGHQIQMLLAKNPSGFDALLSTVRDDHRDVWVAINARIADGRDPSWLYDVAFERLRGHRVKCLGDRRLDLATRLDYAGVEFDVIDEEETLPITDGPTVLLANYTAFSDWLEKSVAC